MTIRLWLALLLAAACRTGRVEVPASGERWIFSPDEKRIYVVGSELSAFDLEKKRLVWQKMLPRRARVVLSRSGRQILVDDTHDFETLTPSMLLLNSDDGAPLQDLLGPPPDDTHPVQPLEERDLREDPPDDDRPFGGTLTTGQWRLDSSGNRLTVTDLKSGAVVLEHQWPGGPAGLQAAVFSSSRLRALTQSGWVFDFDLSTWRLSGKRYLGIPGVSEHAWFHEGGSYSPLYYSGLSPSGDWIVVAKIRGRLTLYR
jgi:hypothetical protein